MPAPLYRYYTADVLTGNVFGEIPLYNVTASMELGNIGEFAGSFPLGQSHDSYMLSVTIPGRTAIYVERNNELIWGGIIWSRIYSNDDDRTVDITAQTFDSYYDHVVLTANYVKQGIEQVNCFQSLVTKVNAQPSSNLGFTCPGITATGVVRTILLPAYEFHFASEVIEQLTVAADGLEYTLELAKTGTVDHPSKTFRLGKIDTLNVTDVIPLDYPGTVQSYTWPENANQGGNKFAGRGGGDGNTAPTAVFTDAVNIRAGFPALWMVTNFPDIVHLATIKSKTQRIQVTNGVPVAKAQLRVDGDIMVGHWQKMGARILFSVLDARWPSGFAPTILRRMYGWNMVFLDGDTQESVTITTDNGVT